MDRPRVVVVGAGVAGLACARELARRGLPVVVLERARGVGGRCATRHVDGRPVDFGTFYLHAKPGLYFTFALNHIGGILFRWYRDTLGGDEVRAALGVPGPGQGRGARVRRLGGPGAEGRGSGGEGRDEDRGEPPGPPQPRLRRPSSHGPPARLGPSCVILGGPDANEPFDPTRPAFCAAAHGASAR